MDKPTLSTIEIYLDGAETDRDPLTTIRPKTASIMEPTIQSPTEGGADSGDATVALSRLPRLVLSGVAYDDIAPVSGGKAADLEIKGTIGEGGMGVVYLAEQPSLRRNVAVKIIRKEVKKPEQLASLLYEARLTGAIEHPGVVPVHAIGLDALGRPVLVMKRVEGVGWDDLISNENHPAWENLRTYPRERLAAHLEIMMSVASTIAFAHSRGVLHRDIKPANILVGAFGEVYVADWGIAHDRKDTKRRHKLGPLGTPSYMAPEMVFGDPASMDERTDVYLLGSTLHVILTGTPRHAGASVRDVLFTAAESEPYEYGPEVPKALAELANRATHRDPECRPQSALEFRDAIQEHLTHRGSLALTAQAQASLAQAHAARKTSGTLARKNLVESRFGFKQALSEWPENPEAKEGLAEALESTLNLELAERSLGGARAALAELGKRPDLEDRVEALAKELDADARDRDEARARARDFDPNVARRKRTTFLVALAVAATGVTFGMRAARQDGDYPVPRTIVLPVLVALVLSPVAWWLRDEMGKSAVNRRFLAIVYTAFGLSATLRALAYTMQTHIVHLMVFEIVVISACSAMLAITFHRSFAFVAAGAVVCAFCAATHFDLVEFFYVPPIIALVALSALIRRST